MLQTKIVEKITTHALCSITFFLKSCRLWDNVEKCCRAGQVTGGNTIRRMRFAGWITKATDTRSEYAIHIASQRQDWLRERSSVLRYTYVVCPPHPPFINHVFLTFCIIYPFCSDLLSFSHFSILRSSRFFVMKNHACWDHFYAVSSSLILVWPLWARIPENLPTKVVNCVVLYIVCV